MPRNFGVHTMELNQREIMSEITLTLKMPKLFSIRLWLGTKIVKLGSRVLGCSVEIES